MLSRERSCQCFWLWPGWRGIFAAGAALLLLLLMLNVFFLRESPEACGLPAPTENPLNLFAGNEVSAERKGIAAILKPLVKSPSFWLICMLSLGTTLLREPLTYGRRCISLNSVGLDNAQAASSSALFPLCGGVSVLFAGILSDYLGPKAVVAFFVSVFASPSSLYISRPGASSCSEIYPYSSCRRSRLSSHGPYSYLGGAMSLDFGEKEGSATASGLIDGVGYLAGVLSGNSMAHIAVNFGWPTMFKV